VSCDNLHQQFLETFIQQEGLNDIFRRNATDYFNAYAHRLAQIAEASSRPIIVGVNGAQGSGKSTLSQYLSQMMPMQLGVDCHVLSIDDFYLSKAKRKRLAASVHPLLGIRGVPGTHDVPRLLDALAEFIDPGVQSVTVPIFDKLADDRTRKVQRIQKSAKPTVILFEGWCVGVPAQHQLALSVPASSFEFSNDKNGVWRSYVNERLGGDYVDVFKLLDRLSMLKPPCFEAIYDWRVDQEIRLVARRREDSSDTSIRGMSVKQVGEFVENFRRLTCHAIEVLPDLAVETWELQADRLVLKERLRS
jgi:D-glycerate 3-kinase